MPPPLLSIITVTLINCYYSKNSICSNPTSSNRKCSRSRNSHNKQQLHAAAASAALQQQYQFSVQHQQQQQQLHAAVALQQQYQFEPPLNHPTNLGPSHQQQQMMMQQPPHSGIHCNYRLVSIQRSPYRHLQRRQQQHWYRHNSNQTRENKN